MPRIYTANNIINRTAVEVGLTAVTDPVSSTDDNFTQLTGLLNSAGQELVELHAWEVLEKVYSLVTSDTDSGAYQLPDDWAYMIDQTGWDQSNNVPVAGPLSAQTWTYLEGRDLVTSTIYASFRLAQGEFDLFPQPPPDALEISFRYIMRNWVREPGGLEKDSVGLGSDLVLYEPILAIKMLKMKWLEAKGFDSTKASIEFNTIFDSRAGKDAGAPVLSASNTGRGMPYLSPWNTPDSGFGQ